MVSKTALTNASLRFHGLFAPGSKFHFISSCILLLKILVSLLCAHQTASAGKLVRIAIIPRKMAARTIKKMQVPAYWPVVLGDQASEYRGVLMELKKTIIMSPIDIMPMEFMSMPDMEASAVEEAIMLPEVIVMDMPDMSLMPDMAVDVGMLMPDMLLMSISANVQ